MNTFRCYSIRVCDYLTRKGFQYITVCQDIKIPNFNNWIFEKTPELQAALDEYFAEH